MKHKLRGDVENQKTDNDSIYHVFRQQGAYDTKTPATINRHFLLNKIDAHLVDVGTLSTGGKIWRQK